MYTPDFNGNTNDRLTHRLEVGLSRYAQHYNFGDGPKSNASSTTEDAWSHSSFESWCEDQSIAQNANTSYDNSIVSSQLHTAIGCSTDLAATRAAFTQFYVMDNTQRLENNVFGERIHEPMPGQSHNSQGDVHNGAAAFDTNSVGSFSHDASVIEANDTRRVAAPFDDAVYNEPLNLIINQMNEQQISLGPIVPSSDPVKESMDF